MTEKVIYVWAIFDPKGNIVNVDLSKDHTWYNFIYKHPHSLPRRKAIKDFKRRGFTCKKFKLVEVK